VYLFKLEEGTLLIKFVPNLPTFESSYMHESPIKFVPNLPTFESSYMHESVTIESRVSLIYTTRLRMQPRRNTMCKYMLTAQHTSCGNALI